MKKVILTLLIVANLAFANDIDFKKGFETAVEAVKLELINGSNFNKVLNYKYPKLLYIDTKSLSTNEILIAQYIAFTNGFIDVGYTGEKMYFASYLRDADRDQAKDKLERLLSLKIRTENNNQIPKFATPILDRSFYIQKREIVVGAIKQAEISDTKDRTKAKKEQKKVQKANNAKYFKIKNDALIYDIKDIKGGAFAFLCDVKMTQQKPTKDIYKYGRTITVTDTGNKYVKVYNDNIFFRFEDIEFMENK